VSFKSHQKLNSEHQTHAQTDKDSHSPIKKTSILCHLQNKATTTKPTKKCHPTQQKQSQNAKKPSPSEKVTAIHFFVPKANHSCQKTCQ
jgi:hypothetical protein